MKWIELLWVEEITFLSELVWNKWGYNGIRRNSLLWLNRSSEKHYWWKLKLSPTLEECYQPDTTRTNCKRDKSLQIMQYYLWQQCFMLAAKNCRKSYWELQMKFSINRSRIMHYKHSFSPNTQGNKPQTSYHQHKSWCCYRKTSENISSVPVQK